MAKAQSLQAKADAQLSKQFYVYQRRDERPLYILASSQEKAVEGAKWFCGGLPVVGEAKDLPVLGHMILVETEPDTDRPNHSGFVTRTFTKPFPK